MSLWLLRTKRYSTNVIISASLDVLFIGVPLIACVSIIFLPIRQCLSSISTTQIRRHLHFLRNCNPISLFSLFSAYPPPYTTYPDAASEEAYWTSAFSGQRKLASSNDNMRLGTAVPGLIIYYAPALLPVYRDESKRKKKGVEGACVYISPRTFLKWYQIVFPDSIHPTLDQASHWRWNFTDRDRREMRRIVKTDRRAVRRHPKDKRRSVSEYKVMRRRWMEGGDSGRDLVVTFA